MAFLGKAKKQDLVLLAEELGQKVSDKMTNIELRNIIIGSKDYEEEFVRDQLSVILEERLERESGKEKNPATTRIRVRENALEIERRDLDPENLSPLKQVSVIKKVQDEPRDLQAKFMKHQRIPARSWRDFVFEMSYFEEWLDGMEAVIDTGAQISVVRADVVEGQSVDSGGTIQIMSAFGEREQKNELTFDEDEEEEKLKLPRRKRKKFKAEGQLPNYNKSESKSLANMVLIPQHCFRGEYSQDKKWAGLDSHLTNHVQEFTARWHLPVADPHVLYGNANQGAGPGHGKVKNDVEVLSNSFAVADTSITLLENCCLEPFRKVLHEVEEYHQRNVGPLGASQLKWTGYRDAQTITQLCGQCDVEQCEQNCTMTRVPPHPYTVSNVPPKQTDSSL
ncbi:hypothetical protein TNCV_4752891 [Trichonephila clavipes]|nr:hypothetical protein TNCV_4752891 [Trichonephila clavipes]